MGAIAAGARLAPPAPLRAQAVGPLDGEPAVHPDEAEIAVHRPLLLVDAGAEQLARPLLGAPLATGIAELTPLRAPARPGPGLPGPPPSHLDRTNGDRCGERRGEKRQD